jgi:hypothetical protein
MSPDGDALRFPVERRQPPRLEDIHGLIEAFGYSERWWRYRITEGLPCHKWGSRLRFDLTKVQAWLEQRYAQA